MDLDIQKCSPLITQKNQSCALFTSRERERHTHTHISPNMDRNNIIVEKAITLHRKYAEQLFTIKAADGTFRKLTENMRGNFFKKLPVNVLIVCNGVRCKHNKKNMLLIALYFLSYPFFTCKICIFSPANLAACASAPMALSGLLKRPRWKSSRAVRRHIGSSPSNVTVLCGGRYTRSQKTPSTASCSKTRNHSSLQTSMGQRRSDCRHGSSRSNSRRRSTTQGLMMDL